MNTSMKDFERLRDIISKEKKILRELNSLENYMRQAKGEGKKMIASQINLIKNEFRKTNEEIPSILENINLTRKLNQEKTKEEAKKEIPKMGQEYALAQRPAEIADSSPIGRKYTLKELKPTRLEKETLKRMREKNEKAEVIKEKKPSVYIQLANRWFSKFSEKMVNEKTFLDLERDLIKGNLQFTPRSYFSVIFLTTLISFFAGIVIALFFLFFNIGVILPIVTRATGEIASRLWKVLLIVIFAPILTFILMYIYPGLEKTATETRIEEELPFATIHMSAISGSMIEPSNIFNIIISTHEYPAIEKEFKKLINQINLYGYDLVTALRSSAYNCPSKRLSELFNGLATTVNSGGDLPGFFEKRSQTLLFENSLEQEKKTKAAETFMDIYISLVIAAPMILMILLMMMKMSGLGVSMSTSMITVIMVLAVTMINIVFLTFLQLKK